jgi:hypothetical protein
LADDVPAVSVIASAIIASVVVYPIPMICWSTLNAFWPFLEGE